MKSLLAATSALFLLVSHPANALALSCQSDCENRHEQQVERCNDSYGPGHGWYEEAHSIRWEQCLGLAEAGLRACLTNVCNYPEN
jgi:hypothetical protein